MSVQGLQNPFERLSVLPTTVNWRGAWIDSQTYFKNDVAVSPVNGSSYILTGTTSVNSGGEDPSASVLWSQFSNTSTGVESVEGLAPGITVDNTDPLRPIIQNGGVLTVNSGAAVFVDNTDPQRPIVNSSAIARIAAGTGIQVGGTAQVPIVSNTGVLRIITGAGLSASGQTGDITLSNTGLTSVIAGAGISLQGTATDPVISNSGVQSLVVGAGLASTGGVNPNVSNTGVLQVQALDNSIVIDNTDPQNPIISSEAPLLTFVSSPIPVINVNIQAGATGGIGFAGNDLSIFNQYVLNGAPTPQGVFLVDFSSVNFSFLRLGVSPQVTSSPYSIVYIDNITPGGPFTYQSLTFPSNYFLTLGQDYPIQAFLGQSYFNVADARATGMRKVTGISIRNNTNTTLVIASFGSIFATYYPNGVE